MEAEKEIEQLTVKRQELFELRDAWNGLLANTAFQKYIDMLRAESRVRHNTDYSTLITGLDASFRSAVLRGEISGIQRAIKIVPDELETINEDIDNINQEIEQWQKPPQSKQ